MSSQLLTCETSRRSCKTGSLGSFNALCKISNIFFFVLCFWSCSSALSEKGFFRNPESALGYFEISAPRGIFFGRAQREKEPKEAQSFFSRKCIKEIRKGRVVGSERTERKTEKLTPERERKTSEVEIPPLNLPFSFFTFLYIFGVVEPSHLCCYRALQSF